MVLSNVVPSLNLLALQDILRSSLASLLVTQAVKNYPLKSAVEGVKPEKVLKSVMTKFSPHLLMSLKKPVT